MAVQAGLARTERAARTTDKTTERITVALTARVSRELEQLRMMTHLSKTDLVNRALSLYLFVEQLRSNDKQLAVYDPATNEFQLVHIA